MYDTRMLTEAQLAAKRKWTAKNREKILAYRKSYYKKNTEKVLAINKKWADQNYDQVRATQKAYYESNREKIAQVNQSWQKDNFEKVAQYKKKWIENNPEARAAHIILNNAVKEGKIIKQPCIICGNLKVHAHHPNNNYSEPLNVIWVCAKHHAEIHAKKRLEIQQSIENHQSCK